MLKSNRAAVEREMVALIRKRNAAAGLTVQNEARKLAPVDIGRLRGSITFYSDDTGAVVGTNVSYAVFQELGWSHSPGKPFLVPGLMNAKAALRGIYGGGLNP